MNRSSGLGLCLYAPRCYGIDERGVIALILIGVRLGESRDRVVEDVGRTECCACLACRNRGSLESRPSSRIMTDDLRPPLGIKGVLATRDGNARRQSLHVLFPRSGKGFVEVVEVEEQLPLGRSESAEVGQVRITAQLNTNTALRRTDQVGGHDVRGTTKEGVTGTPAPDGATLQTSAAPDSVDPSLCRQPELTQPTRGGRLVHFKASGCR